MRRERKTHGPRAIRSSTDQEKEKGEGERGRDMGDEEHLLLVSVGGFRKISCYSPLNRYHYNRKSGIYKFYERS